MPSIPIKNPKQYQRAIEVLTEVGGSWQGVGSDEWFLLVNDNQYNALVNAKVIKPKTATQDNDSGRKKNKTPQL